MFLFLFFTSFSFLFHNFLKTIVCRRNKFINELIWLNEFFIILMLNIVYMYLFLNEKFNYFVVGWRLWCCFSLWSFFFLTFSNFCDTFCFFPQCDWIEGCSGLVFSFLPIILLLLSFVVLGGTLMLFSLSLLAYSSFFHSILTLSFSNIANTLKILNIWKK